MIYRFEYTFGGSERPPYDITADSEGLAREAFFRAKPAVKAADVVSVTIVSEKRVKKNKPKVFNPDKALMIEHGTLRYFRDVFDSLEEYEDLRDRVTYKERKPEDFVQEKFDDAVAFLAENSEIVDIFRDLASVMKEVPAQTVAEIYRYGFLPTEIQEKALARRKEALERKQREFNETNEA